MCNCISNPYDVHSKTIFKYFLLENLDQSTVYTKQFGNRSVAYYGQYPYGYTGALHPPCDWTENPYLMKILNYEEFVYPDYKFNSAMVNKYKSGEEFMPHHSDAAGMVKTC